MIDTVCLTLAVRMHSPTDMMTLGFSAACRHPTRFCSHPARWRFHPPKRPHLTWSEAPDHSHWLSLTGSLPRFMFGSNVYLLSSDDELRTCLEGISHYVSSAAQVEFRLFKCELSYSGTMAQSITLTLGMYWEKRLSAAQRRFTRACETLARVRKLSRNTPALQFNIATSGGQQVNLTK
jgi:hypothetical protein